MRGATAEEILRRSEEAISIHAPHAGRDLDGFLVFREEETFQSTRPMRGATMSVSRSPSSAYAFQSTRPMRGATAQSLSAKLSFRFQSTRPMRGATVGQMQGNVILGISIHAPHAGRDPYTLTFFCRMTGFQSTRPMRRATTYENAFAQQQKFQSTRPMRGATGRRAAVRLRYAISIHAPHAGRDEYLGKFSTVEEAFQSTRPMRGATRLCRRRKAQAEDFNPRAPCGARPG